MTREASKQDGGDIYDLNVVFINRFAASSCSHGVINGYSFIES